MLSVTKVLGKVLVARFYERNAGLFFVVFYLMFGIVESSQIVSYHQSLIYATLTSAIFQLMVFGVWLLYSLKCIQFIAEQLRQPQNQFVFQLALINHSQLFSQSLQLILLLHLPVLAYTTFIIALGFQSQNYISVASIIIFQAALYLASARWLVYRIQAQHLFRFKLDLPRITWKWPKPLPLFYLGHLTTQLPTVFFFAKVASLLCIFGFLQIPVDHYEVRVATLGLLFGLASHSVVVFELRKMEERFLLFMRTLPISLLNRFLYLAITYTILLIPEIIMLAINHVHVIDLAGIYLFAIGFLLLCHTHLLKKLDNEKYLQWMLGFFLISFMLVLFKIYWVELIVLWLLGYRYFKKYYYQFEAASETV
ncbi:MAG: hypothetical protein HYZ44_04325 [Bacteroidetes bacterium]|nr:hypothetical protein [Bacteroidota bacterium]